MSCPEFYSLLPFCFENVWAHQDSALAFQVWRQNFLLRCFVIFAYHVRFYVMRLPSSWSLLSLAIHAMYCCRMICLRWCSCLHDSLVTSAYVVCGAFNPATITLEQHAYAGYPSICERRRWSSASIVVVTDVQAETNYVDSTLALTSTSF